VGGTFRAHALPRRAQLSTGFGVLADPLGPDRVALQVSHNFFSPEPETGRTDGGLGAWMVSRLMMELGGAARAHAQEAGGTRIELTVPVSKRGALRHVA